MKSHFVIRRFADTDADAFRQLNLVWINQHFDLEEKDLEMLARPKSLIEDGGVILVAECKSRVIGCVAILRRSQDEVELGKMTVAEKWRRNGVGAAMLRAAVQAARELKAKSIYLESNSVLRAAIALYEQAGFRHLTDQNRPAPAYQSADVFMRLEL